MTESISHFAYMIFISYRYQSVYSDVSVFVYIVFLFIEIKFSIWIYIAFRGDWGRAQHKNNRWVYTTPDETLGSIQI